MRSATATRNACKLCAPLGAVLAFRGVRGAVPFLHGSQGCSTYIRRYMIGHYREPLDVAASNFSEQAAVFGGEHVFRTGIANVVRQYRPELIGVATTCLAETIGDDMTVLINLATKDGGADMPPLVPVSTPSYAGSHAEGFHKTVRALIDHLAEGGPRGNHIVLFPGMQSPADLRALRAVLRAYQLDGVLLSDYADTLDGGAWQQYEALPPGGTSIAAIRSCGRARAAIGLGATLPFAERAESLLADRFSVPSHHLAWPVGLRASDAFHARLSDLSGHPMPTEIASSRARLLDAYVDGHKYLSGKKALLYGEEDLVVALAGFLLEIGITPAAIVSGGCSGRLAKRLADIGCADSSLVRDDGDFVDAETVGRDQDIDLIIGHSKGYWLARRLERPLVRIGFPIHDRMGGARLRLLDYDGSHDLFDRLCNALIEVDQQHNPVGYMCM